MDDLAYKEMDQLEANYWWFVSRRRILESVISKFAKSDNPRILEIGCGTGGNLKMLGTFGKGVGVEMNPGAIEYANKKKPSQFVIREGSFPTKHNLERNEEFNIICLFDVLEHIDEDLETLEILHNHLSFKGKIVLTVPAHRWLWSKHDDFNHHKRRYSKREIMNLAIASGFEIEFLSYFNSLLFPLAVLGRFKTKFLKKSGEDTLPELPKFVNEAFKFIFGLESYLLRFIKFPIGLSIIAVLKHSSD